MLRAGHALRFTPNEVDEFRSLGIDFEGAQTQGDIDHALATWAETLADERPHLLECIVTELARVKGVKPPARLTTMVNDAPSDGSQQQF